jgi:hypothetical protein
VDWMKPRPAHPDRPPDRVTGKRPQEKSIKGSGWIQ